MTHCYSVFTSAIKVTAGITVKRHTEETRTLVLSCLSDIIFFPSHTPLVQTRQLRTTCLEDETFPLAPPLAGHIVITAQ